MMQTCKLTLLVSIERFRKNIIPCHDHDDWEIFVYKGKNTVLEFPRHNSFTVKIRDFLDFQGACEVFNQPEDPFLG